ncbi:MAG: hypothetical protein H6R10_734 [Rhodocyclaceae bacterium]|nr:hypothetical protein [Rhodocyclaceae bacterium]
MIVYDIEIKRAIQAPGEERIPGIEYAEGWHDHAGMGIACICAFDLIEQRYRVFQDDNLDAFADLVEKRPHVVSFNGHRFDDLVCQAAGIDIPAEKSVDIAARIWAAAGCATGRHPKGLGLDDLCRINGIGGKTGDGALAPVLWQQGKRGAVVDYCLADVKLTLGLYRRLAWVGGCIDPRNQGFLKVEVPS